MDSNRFTLRTAMTAACAMALLTIISGAALAAVPSTTAYKFSSHPMISGSVVSVNDHQMVVHTDQGELVTLEVDTRTLAPRDLAPGMVTRTEFTALENCRFYAERIIPLREASAQRFQAYANTHDGDGSAAASAASPRSEPSTMDAPSPGPIVTAVPTNSDYNFATSPAVSGRVVTVNDHKLVVVTDQGQKVGLVMDSRTMVPGQVEPGTVFRANFTKLADGRYYAKRITPDRAASPEREQAYAHTRDSDLLLAESTPDCGFVSATDGNMSTVIERRVDRVRPVIQSAPEPVAETPETLPQTASSQPLILLVGLLALGGAFLMRAARELRSA